MIKNYNTSLGPESLIRYRFQCHHEYTTWLYSRAESSEGGLYSELFLAKFFLYVHD